MRINLFLLAAVLALGATLAAGSDEKIVMLPVSLESGAPINESVRRDCAIENNLGSHIFKNVNERFPGAEQGAGAGSDPGKIVLRVTVIAVTGAGGGAWSGSKAISIRADALQGAKVIVSKTLSRQSGGGVFGGVSGTCSIMDRIAGALGRDVAAWLPGALATAKTQAPSPSPSPSLSPEKPAAQPSGKS
ncbi:MAG TPA: hypothetical protein VF943_03265 [Burkholderiales bacterium]